MKLTILGFAILTLAAASAAPGQSAPATPADATAALKGSPDPFAQALAVRSIAEFARRQHDATAMLTAARMLQEIPFMGSADGDATFTPKGLFEEARQMAKGDQMLLMQIQVAQSTGSRGVSVSAFGKGLVRRVQTVQPRAGYQFTVQADGGSALRVGAIGDVGTALAMRMRDTAGHVVCMDDHGDYGPVCQLTPKAAASYKIEILNKSAVTSRAVILSN